MPSAKGSDANEAFTVLWHVHACLGKARCVAIPIKRKENPMKTRMKRLASIRSMPALALACGMCVPIVAGSALAAGSARAPVSIYGEVDLSTISGTATAVIGENGA